MIVITGAAGFIGSCLVRKLNDSGRQDMILVDDFSFPQKNKNIEDKRYKSKMDRALFIDYFAKYASSTKFVFHLGARTDTAEKSTAIFEELNLSYSKRLWQICSQKNIPFVYASSAATYGFGEHGYEDAHEVVSKLKPLNPYGVSKNDFDKWVLGQLAMGEERPPFWAGLKFFNVYGPNEYHKGRMASVVLHTLRQIKQTGVMQLFRSHRPDVADGHQSRDFIYVKDVVEVCGFFLQNQTHSGLYNVGTGKARSFLDLATATFGAMGLPTNISFVDTPKDIRDSYQYFTEANMSKLRAAGYDRPFHSLEDGVCDYVKNYLQEDKIW